MIFHNTYNGIVTFKIALIKHDSWIISFKNEKKGLIKAIDPKSFLHSFFTIAP